MISHVYRGRQKKQLPMKEPTTHNNGLFCSRKTFLIRLMDTEEHETKTGRSERGRDQERGGAFQRKKGIKREREKLSFSQ